MRLTLLAIGNLTIQASEAKASHPSREGLRDGFLRISGPFGCRPTRRRARLGFVAGIQIHIGSSIPAALAAGATYGGVIYGLKNEFAAKFFEYLGRQQNKIRDRANTTDAHERTL